MRVCIQCGLRDRYFSTSASVIRVGSVGRRKGTDARGSRGTTTRKPACAVASTLQRRPRSPRTDRKLTCGRVTIVEIRGDRERKKKREEEKERERECERGKRCFLAGRERASDELRNSLGGREAFKDEDGDGPDNENKGRVQQTCCYGDVTVLNAIECDWWIYERDAPGIED